jgi:adenosylhomocysteine nucleosidase
MPNRFRHALKAVLVILSLAVASTANAAPVAETPRTAILCAYEPEWEALLPVLQDRHEAIYSGIRFVSGRIGNRDVVVVETGISMVNAAMAAQLTLDHYAIANLIVMGIAGGVDPTLHIGDVAVPEQWSEYLEAAFAREDHGAYTLPSFSDQSQKEHFGMIFPQPVEVNRAPAQPEQRRWFPVDAHLLEIARRVAPTVSLRNCNGAGECLSPKPQVVVGGNGVSGQAFVDNAAFRAFTARVFSARALDMESAAVAQVAYANKTPFIAFRSLSDLAGGDAGATKMKVFQDLAAGNAAAFLEAFVRDLP